MAKTTRGPLVSFKIGSSVGISLDLDMTFDPSTSKTHGCCIRLIYTESEVRANLTIIERIGSVSVIPL